jgi:hypothetical protein
MRITRIALALGATLAFSAALAGGKSVEVSVLPDGRYNVEAYRFGAAELVGYFGDRKEEAGLETVVFKGVTAQNEGALAKLAARAGLKSFAKEDGKLRELVVEGGSSGAAPAADNK